MYVCRGYDFSLSPCLCIYNGEPRIYLCISKNKAVYLWSSCSCPSLVFSLSLSPCRSAQWGASDLVVYIKKKASLVYGPPPPLPRRVPLAPSLTPEPRPLMTLCRQPAASSLSRCSLISCQIRLINLFCASSTGNGAVGRHNPTLTPAPPCPPATTLLCLIPSSLSPYFVSRLIFDLFP